MSSEATGSSLRLGVTVYVNAVRENCTFSCACRLFAEHKGSNVARFEIYGEMELLRLLDQLFDRAPCFATEGYEQYIQLQN